MRINLLLVMPIMLIFCSCTGAYFPYLNATEEEYLHGPWENNQQDCLFFVCTPLIGFADNSRFELEFHMRLKNTTIISFNIDSLCIQDRNGRLLPFEYSYVHVFNPDTINVMVNGDKIHAVFGNLHQRSQKPNLAIFAKCQSMAKVVKIHYEFEINGDHYKGDAEFRKKIWINSKPSLPGQPWIIDY